MNALRAPLTALAAQQEKCCYFLLDSADVVIEETLIKFYLSTRQPGYSRFR
jgi:hypothetical protein